MDTKKVLGVLSIVVIILVIAYIAYFAVMQPGGFTAGILFHKVWEILPFVD